MSGTHLHVELDGTESILKKSDFILSSHCFLGDQSGFSPNLDNLITEGQSRF